MAKTPVINEQLDTQNDILMRIANKLGAYEEPLSWLAIASETALGRISRYLSAGDPTTVNESGLITVDVGASTGVTGANVAKDTFIAAVGETGTYEFDYNGSAWEFEDSAVTLSDYGITPTGTAVSGDTIIVRYTATAAIYDVCGIDEEEPVLASKKHVLSLLRRACLSNLCFDPETYLFAVTEEACTHFGWDAATGMPAGTYNITLNHGAYDNSTTEDSTYQFTTTQAVPVGGGIRHTKMGESHTFAKSTITGGTFRTYSSDRLTTIETGLACTEGSSGTNLGTTTCKDPQYKSGDYIYFTQAQFYGNADWAESFIRQVLNSWDQVFTFVPATIWSRPISGTIEGFIHTLDPAVQNVLVKVRKRYARNISHGYGYIDCEDYITLATMLDVFGSQNNSIHEGPVTSAGVVTRTVAKSLFKDVLTTAADKIKLLNGAARNWWLSSTNPSNSNNERNVHSSGTLNNNNAINSNGVVPVYSLTKSTRPSKRWLKAVYIM